MYILVSNQCKKITLVVLTDFKSVQEDYFSEVTCEKFKLVKGIICIFWFSVAVNNVGKVK